MKRFIFEFRRGTAAEWATKNPILRSGEPGVESDTGKFKLGDGVHSWSDLSYYLNATSVLTLIQEAVEDAVIDGVQGPPGDSAYDVAVSNGFEGDEDAWLLSLVGPPGVPGDPGMTGVQGEPGEPGVNGESAYEIALGNGFSGTQSEWLASLVGPKGDTGDQGPQGDPGTDGADGAKGDKGDTGDQGPKGDKGDPGDDGFGIIKVWNDTDSVYDIATGATIYVGGPTDPTTLEGEIWIPVPA